MTSVAVATVVGVGLTPTALALAGNRVGALAVVLGVIAALGVDAARALCDARGTWRPVTAHGRYLTARTWTGARTVDLHALRSVRARRVASRTGKTDYVIVRDTAGVCMAFSKPADLRLIRAAIPETASAASSPAFPQVSRLASAALGLAELPRGLSPLWSLGSLELTFAVAVIFMLPALELSGR